MNDTDKLLKEYLKGDQTIDDVLSTVAVLPEKDIIVEDKVEEIKPEVIVEEIPIPEPVIKEVIVEKEIIVEREVIPNESIVILLSEVKDLKSDLEMLKEAIVEILNKTLQSDKLFKEKLTSVSSQQRKKIILNRDESGKIVSAETVEIKEGE